VGVFAKGYPSIIQKCQGIFRAIIGIIGMIGMIFEKSSFIFILVKIRAV